MNVLPLPRVQVGRHFEFRLRFATFNGHRRQQVGRRHVQHGGDLEQLMDEELLASYFDIGQGSPGDTDRWRQFFLDFPEMFATSRDAGADFP